MKLNFFSLLILLLSSITTAMAQNTINQKFGKPTTAELQMTVYPADTSAQAVVLCRLTDVTYTIQQSGYLVDYHERWRIKVLKPGGERFAHVIVPYKKNMSGTNVGGLKNSLLALPMGTGTAESYFSEESGSMTDGIFGTDGDESVEDIKATAFTQQGGRVVKTAMKKGDIRTIMLSPHDCQVEFTVPGVTVGTVIEYEYTVHSQVFWELHDWTAQCDIPVAYARLDMNIPTFLIFNIEDRGVQRLSYTCTAGTIKYKLESDPLAAPVTVSSNHYVYVGANLMAVPLEGNEWNHFDQCAGIVAELKQYRLPGMLPMDYAKTWDQIDTMILASDDLGQHLADHSPLASLLREARIADIANPRERAAAVFRTVMTRVHWNGRYALCPADPAETLKQSTGTNADINLLLLQSLRDVGLNAAPVVLRSRDQGHLPYNFPSLRKLSTFIVALIPTSGPNIYLDASATLQPPMSFTLPDVLRVDRARLIQKGSSQWLNLQK